MARPFSHTISDFFYELDSQDTIAELYNDGFDARGYGGTANI